MSDRPQVNFLSGGARLHLQHGPIDLIIGADGDRFPAFIAAQQRFNTVLSELVSEMDALRTPLSATIPPPSGEVALRMHLAAMPFCETFVTRMVCVAGAVADTVLQAMTDAMPLGRAYVNNGGDIALHLSEGAQFSMAIARDDGKVLGHLQIEQQDGIGGVATSGRHGRSLSMGIADAVTVLAHDAASADAAATLIANAVDLPGHPLVRRQAAHEIDENSDLGAQLVVTGCANLTKVEVDQALERGVRVAETLIEGGKILDVALFLEGQSRILGRGRIEAGTPDRIKQHA